MPRKLVTIRPVKNKSPIKKADVIERVTVDGWNVISKIGQFNIGDYGLFFEVDSGVPIEDSRFDFLSSGGFKDFHGKHVYRIRTMKMRKCVSQGLLMPLDNFPEIENYLVLNNISLEQAYKDKIDFAEMLDVVKYEPPMKIRGADSAGDFPFWIHKTEQERINNVFDELVDENKDREFYATLKMDGTSATYAYVTDSEKHYETLTTDENGGQFFVCSKNHSIKPGENAFYYAADELEIEMKLKRFHLETGRNIAIQGECLGRGIQGTREKIYDYTVKFFSVFDIDNQEYLPFRDALDIFKQLKLDTVDIIDTFKPFERFSSVEDVIDYSDNIQPRYADIPEGIVYHSVNAPFISFKAISKQYLLKNEGS